MFAVTTRRSTDGMGPDLLGLRNRINWFFDSPDQVNSTFVNGGNTWLPAMDVFEDGENYHLVLEIPGITPEDVSLTLDNSVLTIRGRKATPELGEVRLHRRERAYGEFERSLTLPGDVKGDSIRASYDAGLLHVTLAKPERARARQIPIEIAAKTS